MRITISREMQSLFGYLFIGLFVMAGATLVLAAIKFVAWAWS